ncbi:MAG: RNA 2',3'-cyclic phosphodiesterase [Alphaproteobacteria bacterium]
MIRLFVALSLPGELRQRLKTLCNGVRDARWVEEQNIHLTLRFIGEVEEPELAYIMAALSSVQAEQFDLTLSGVGHFESRQKVRSLWAGIQPSPALEALQQRIESVLTRHGIAPDGRKFSPHITLARLKQLPPAYVRDWLEGNSYFQSSSFAVEDFTLFESYRARSGAIYTPLQAFPLNRERVK